MNSPSQIFSILLGAIAFLLSACSASSMMEVKKEESFYTTFQNQSSESGQAEKNIEKIKLLTVGEDYPIRLALFKNNQFYYEVDKLGKGYGTWKFEEGGLHLTTKRKIFDMNFYVSAATQDGDALIVKFFDSTGHNEYSLQFRNPEKDSNLEKLREFKETDKDI